MEWISIDDKLPENNQIVLASGKNRVLLCQFEIGRKNEDGIFMKNERIFYFRRKVIPIMESDRITMPYFTDITHWMPLPLSFGK